MTVTNDSGQFLSFLCRTDFERLPAEVTQAPLCAQQQRSVGQNFRPQRKNVHRALRIQGNGGQTCSGQLALKGTRGWVESDSWF